MIGKGEGMRKMERKEKSIRKESRKWRNNNEREKKKRKNVRKGGNNEDS